MLQEENRQLKFQLYNFQEFIFIGHNLYLEKNKESLDSFKDLEKQYPILKDFIIIGYNSLGYNTSCVLIRKNSELNNCKLFYFSALEGNIEFFINTTLLTKDILLFEWKKHLVKDIYYDVNNCDNDYKNLLKEYAEIPYDFNIYDFTENINKLIKKYDFTLSLKEDDFYLNGEFIYKNKGSHQYFGPKEILFLLESKLKDFISFNVFLEDYKEAQSFAFGIIKNKKTETELKNKGYIKNKYITVKEKTLINEKNETIEKTKETEVDKSSKNIEVQKVKNWWEFWK